MVKFQSVTRAEVGDLLTLGWGTLNVVKVRVKKVLLITQPGAFPQGFWVTVERPDGVAFGLHMSSGIGYDFERVEA